MSEIQKFEALLDDYVARARGRMLVNLECSATAEFEARWAVLLSWRAAYEAGEIAMREKAVKVARDEGDAPREDGGNCARWDACDNVARAIRALPLSGDEESKK